MASIIITSGPNKGDYYPLGQRTNVLGRAETNPIQILDEKVSRKHLQIHFDQQNHQYHALDMKSRSGVFINGKKIESETVLVDEDEIRLGETNLLFTLKEFDDTESAMSHFKKVGERKRDTLMD